MKRMPFFQKRTRIITAGIWLWMMLCVFVTTGQTVADFHLEKLDDTRFQISMITNITYPVPDNRVNSMQITIRTRSAGFEVGAITSLVAAGTPDEVLFEQQSRYNQPVENPNFDYISFRLVSNATTQIPFQQNDTVPLFTFVNSGFCTDAVVSIIPHEDPFYPSGDGIQNSGNQLTVLGYGQQDAPVGNTGMNAADCQSECFMGCDDNVQITLNSNCIAEVRPEMIASVLHLTCPNGPKSIEILENGQVIPTNPFLNETHLGKTFDVRVIDSLTTNSCWGSIIVKDKAPPVFECRDDTISCVINDYSPDSIGYPIVIDNCTDSVASLIYVDSIVIFDCNEDLSGRVQRTWTATDSVGLQSTCVQNIYFEKLALSDVVFPADRDGVDAPVVSCTENSVIPSETGTPTINGESIYPAFNGFCQIIADYEDREVGYCSGNRQIVRTWTVVDNCTSNTRTEIQFIHVRDTTPPEISCPDPIITGTDPQSCRASVSLPSMEVADKCSDVTVRIFTPFGNIDANGGSLVNVPTGTHRIIYSASDACGNEARCTTSLQVQDLTAPVAACDFINDIQLREDGTVDVDALTFDDGSLDACSGSNLTFQVKRLGDTLDFADFVTFTCADVGDTVRVRMQVTDPNNNVDECTAAVVITSNTAPNMTCPADTIVDCKGDFTDLSRFGTPIIMDQCGGTANYQEQITYNLNNCGTGRIIRTFVVPYADGDVSCQQTIEIIGSGSFDGNTIQWPSDYTTENCDLRALSVEELPSGYDVPVYDTDEACGNILQFKSEELLDKTPDPVGCFVLLRTWEIIDECVFNPSDTAAGGYWKHTQRLEITNSTPPAFDNCGSDIVAYIDDNSCSANVLLNITATDDCTLPHEVRYSYSIDLDSDGVVEETGHETDISGSYPAGTHRIFYSATDDCGNSQFCQFDLIILDTIQPTLICNTNTIDTFDIVNNDSRRVAINPQSLVQSAGDNCTDTGNLIYVANPPSFGCEELGDQEVTVTVLDESGNFNSCRVVVHIADRQSVCPANRNAVNISGLVVNEMGDKIDRVQISINDPEVTPAITNESGEFMLREVPVEKDYTISPQRDFDVLNGISTFDLVLISRHILNYEPITSPYRLIAADVNRSGSVTVLDIVQLRKLILRLSEQLPNNQSWRFVRSDFVFENPEKACEINFPEVYNINNLPRQDMQLPGFIGIKVGDVNASANPHKKPAAEGRSKTGTLSLLVENQDLVAGNTIDVPINVKNIDELLGLQLALYLNPNQLELTTIIPNENINYTQEHFGTNWLKRGLLTTSWFRTIPHSELSEKTTLFTLRLKALDNGKLSEMLMIQPDFIPAEAYQVTDTEVVNEENLLDIELVFGSYEANRPFELIQNRPNPFSEGTTIGFYSTQKETMLLSIIDVSGKTIFQKNIPAQAGYQEIFLEKERFEENGFYYCRLAGIQGVQMVKMLRVE